MNTIFTLEKLWRAYKDCQTHKKNTINALKFELNRERNLIKLLHDLRTRKYEISRHVCFIVTKPTPREIFAADFRDRIVHHLLYRELYHVIDADLIDSSYANRRGKGTHAAVYRLRFLIQGMRGKAGGGFCLKLDVKSFFRSIDRALLFRILEDKLTGRVPGYVFNESHDETWRKEVLWLARKIIFNEPTQNYLYKGNPAKKSLIPKNKSLFYSAGRGLPIGNLTSQFFANVYLNELDQFVTKTLGFKRYVRYVDDFVLLSEDKEKLRASVKVIDDFLQQRLHLGVHPGKINLQPVSHGVDYLGYFVKPTHMLVRQKIIKRFKNKLHRISRATEDVSEDQAKTILPMVNSYYGHLCHAQSYALRIALYNDHMIKLKKLITFKDQKSASSLLLTKNETN